METSNYYAIIPANVRYDTRLKANEKLLYGEITSLAHKDGTCWATNEYFAKLYSVRKEQISRWIANLIECNYLHSEYTYRDGTREIDKRYLSIIIHQPNNDLPPIAQKRNTSCVNTHDPIAEKSNTPLRKNAKRNNTSMNNTSLISNTPLPPEGDLVENTKTEFVGDKNQQPVFDKFQAEYGGDTSKSQKTFKVLKPSTPLPEFNYDGFNDAEMEMIQKWFAYCKEIKKSYKSLTGLAYFRDYCLELKASNSLIGAIKYSLIRQYKSVIVPERTIKNNHNLPKKSFNEVHDYTANAPVNQVDRF